MKYGEAIRVAIGFSLAQDPNCLVIGQGLWSPWYVGSTMQDLEKIYGKSRVIDTPVSELATTGVGVGLALMGYRPVVTHPRVDFALLALDQIVNQAAKWNSMFGGDAPVPAVFRLIVNRGGEQGAQHSQSLYSWFAHIPGLRVVAPATPQDAQDLLVAAVFSDDPVVYIDDRWLYDIEEDVVAPRPLEISDQLPKILREGKDITLVGFSWSTQLVREAAHILSAEFGIEAEVIDLRVLNPLDASVVISSVRKTRNLLVAEGDWLACGIAAELVCRVTEAVDLRTFRSKPRRIGLKNAPAPTSRVLETDYYPRVEQIVDIVRTMMEEQLASLD